MSLGAKPVETPKAEEVPKAEPPKEEPKKEVISPFVLHPLAELCSKFSYNDSNFIAAVRRNLSVLAGNPQERFYAEGYKALIIHGARLLDDNGNLLIHIETAEHGHAIVKVTQSGYQDCTGSMTVGDIIMANARNNAGNSARNNARNSSRNSNCASSRNSAKNSARSKAKKNSKTSARNK